MRARSFFYVAAGLFLLVTAYSIGAHRADAQAGGSIVAIGSGPGSGVLFAVASNGDVYTTAPAYFGFCIHEPPYPQWCYAGNVFGAGPVGTTPKTWSGVKGDFHK